jgi:hypothetical protein
VKPAHLAAGNGAGHRLLWAAPRPLWRGATSGRQPALLRFATDDFMDRLIQLLETDPARRGELAARPESWRDAPAPAAADPLSDPARLVPLPAMLRANRRQRLAASAGKAAEAPTDPRPLKLWQPAQQRYYLVAASPNTGWPARMNAPALCCGGCSPPAALPVNMALSRAKANGSRWTMAWHRARNCCRCSRCATMMPPAAECAPCWPGWCPLPGAKPIWPARWQQRRSAWRKARPVP